MTDLMPMIDNNHPTPQLSKRLSTLKYNPTIGAIPVSSNNNNTISSTDTGSNNNNNNNPLVTINQSNAAANTAAILTGEITASAYSAHTSPDNVYRGLTSAAAAAIAINSTATDSLSIAVNRGSLLIGNNRTNNNHYSNTNRTASHPANLSELASMLAADDDIPLIQSSNNSNNNNNLLPNQQLINRRAGTGSTSSSSTHQNLYNNNNTPIHSNTAPVLIQSRTNNNSNNTAANTIDPRLLTKRTVSFHSLTNNNNTSNINSNNLRLINTSTSSVSSTSSNSQHNSPLLRQGSLRRLKSNNNNNNTNNSSSNRSNTAAAVASINFIRKVQSAADFHSIKRIASNNTINTAMINPSIAGSASAASVSAAATINSQYQLSLLTEKLRDMQLEVSRLNSTIKQYQNDSMDSQWFLRYSRRLIIISNFLLALWMAVITFINTVRKRSIKRNLINSLFIPINSINLTNPPLSSVLISALLNGLQSSAIFICSALFHLRSSSLKRNLGFVFSTSYSCYLLINNRLKPPAANYMNILMNILYIAARYYYLHGLLVFNSMRIL